MIVSTYITLALRCPICGKMDFYAVSRFKLSNSSRVNINCECGSNLLSLGRYKNQHYWVQLECSLCERKHIFCYTARQLWNGNLQVLICEETNLEIGFIGPRDEVRKRVQEMDKSWEDIAEDLGQGDYFNSSDIMYKVLEHLHLIAEKDRIFCSCGNHNLELEVYPDRIELNCFDCGAVGVVFAETIKDMETIKKLQEIILAKGTFKYVEVKLKKTKRNLKK